MACAMDFVKGRVEISGLPGNFQGSHLKPVSRADMREERGRGALVIAALSPFAGTRDRI